MTKEEILKALEKPTSLDHQRMIEEINELVNTDEYGELELKLLPGSKPYTQKEAKRMCGLLGQIYMIAHCVSCKACASRYHKEPPK